jgi:hypothetical protein
MSDIAERVKKIVVEHLSVDLCGSMSGFGCFRSAMGRGDCPP